MSDLRTRELSRADDPAVRVALLRERLRAGELTMPQLTLAAYLGDTAAREAGATSYTVRLGEVCCCGIEAGAAEHGAGGLDHYTHSFVHACSYYAGEDYVEERDCACEVTVEVRTSYPPIGPYDLSRLLHGLEWWPGAPLRAAIAAAWATLPASCCGETNPECYRSCSREAEVIDAAERWLLDPSEANREEWDALWASARSPWTHLPTPPYEGEDYNPKEDSTYRAAGMVDEKRARKAITESLLRWALGDAR